MKSLKDGHTIVQPVGLHIANSDVWKLTLARPSPHPPISQIRKLKDGGVAQGPASEGI